MLVIVVGITTLPFFLIFGQGDKFNLFMKYFFDSKLNVFK